MVYKPLIPGRHGNRHKKPTELLLVPMIDIFSVLVTFLLMTAVFSRITVIQLDLPSAASAAPAEPQFRLEVIVRKEGLEVTNGQESIAALPVVAGEYDLKGLTGLVMSLKRDHPQSDDASVLMARDVEYDKLIQVMDAIRSADQNTAAAAGLVAATGAGPVALFTKIAVGDAP